MNCKPLYMFTIHTERPAFWPLQRLGKKNQYSMITGKRQGGGVCLYINKRWCNSVIVRETFCTQDIELLSVSLRPFYLP